jgi:predicted nucleic acid-binding protein
MPNAPEQSCIALDTSVIVAGLLSWHGRHEAARQNLEAVLAVDEVVLPVHVLLESYSVMTRLLAPHRLAPADAAELLEGTFRRPSRLAGIPANEMWGLVRALADRGVAGGAVYDAEILECARRAGATKVLALNPRHFERVATEEIEVSSPDEG